MKKHIRVLVVLCCSLVLTACGGGAWEVLKNSESYEEAGFDATVAIIERHPDRLSPQIKIFQHMELGVYKESAGSRWNDLYARDRVITAPGNIRIGVVLDTNSVYYPELEFVTRPEHQYFITWVCIPYPFVAAVDAKSNKYVGIDSYCSGCDNIIGTLLSERSQCLNHRRPAWIKPDPERHFLPWLSERVAYMYESLCNAAGDGVISAQKNLGLYYSLGLYGYEKDMARAYFWYQLAANAGDSESMNIIQSWMDNNTLSSTELGEASRLVKAQAVGQCKEKILGEYKPEYNLETH